MIERPAAHRFTDAVALSGTRLTGDGYLITEARAVRTGIQLYSRREVGLGDGKPNDLVRVYRPAEEVFADESLRSFTHAPITDDHPREQVTAENWKELAVGEVSTQAKKDGEWVHLPLILKDARTIKAIQGGKRELSAGYSCELDFTPGVTEDGQAYDARQTSIRINHLAVVDRARAGSKARIGDGAGSWGASPVDDHAPAEKERNMDLRKVTVDGLSVETTDAGAQAIERLQNDLRSSAAKLADAEAAGAKALADLKAANDAALAAKDAELAKRDAALAAKDAEVDALKAKVVSDADLDKRVLARADLVAKAQSIAKDVKFEGMADAMIKRAAVTALLGDAAVKDKPDAYVDARFDIAVEDAAKAAGTGLPGSTVIQGDAFRQVRAGGVLTVASDADAAAKAEKARMEREAEQRDAWKKKDPKAA